MEKVFKTGFAIMMLAAGCVGFTSCSDDNDEPEGNGTPGVVEPSNVFTGEMPESVAGMTISRNADGLVTEMRTTDGKIITFDYPAQARATEETGNVKMTVTENDVKIEYDMTIGSKGFVSKSFVKVTSGNSNENEEGDWTFTYDSEGHLTKARHIAAYTDAYGEEEDYTVILKWKNGNITKTYKDEGWDNYTYMYTSADYPTAIENKGALFMFEDIYPIEIYDFEWVYYAGMLGKAPKNLAVAHYENEDADDEYEYEQSIQYFIWTLDQNGYPTLFDVKDDDHPGESTVRFTW